MIIALLTDFGTKDYFVAAMKGTVLSINDKVNIVDISHEIAPQQISEASFTLRACYKNFPAQTIFVAVVDPGVGSDRRAILVETENYYFIAPDNGLLSFVFDKRKNFKVYELTNKKFFPRKVSRTFHGRDIFAPIAAHLSVGIEPQKFGAEIGDYIYYETPEPEKTSEKTIEARIVHIDQFGNLVTNLREKHLPEKFTVEIGNRTIGTRRDFYAEAEKDELFAIIGSAGFMEIVVFQNSARRMLHVEVGETVKLIVN